MKFCLVRKLVLRYGLVLGLIGYFPIQSLGQTAQADSLHAVLRGTQPDGAYVKNTLSLFTLLSAEVEHSRLRQYPHYLETYLKNAIHYVAGIADAPLLARMQMAYLLYLHKSHEAPRMIALAMKMLQKGVFYDPEDEYSIYFYLCETYQHTQYYAKYIETIPKKYEAYRRLKLNHAANANESSDIGVAYYNMGDYGQARAYYFKALKKAIRDQRFFFVAGIYNNIALCFREERKADSARYYFRKAIRQVEATQAGGKKVGRDALYKQYFIDVIYGNIAEMEAKTGVFDNNIPIIQKQIKGGLLFKEEHIYLGAWHNLASIYYQKHQPDRALQYLDSALTEIKRLKNIDFLIGNLGLRGKVLLLKGQLAMANAAFEQEQSLSDSVKNAQREHLSEIAAVIYETQQKETQIAKQQAELQKKGSDLILKSQQQTFMWLAMISLLLLVGIALVTIRKMIRDKKVIEAQEAATHKALKQKELLIKEIHHRVKNNLQVVSGILHIQANKIENDALKKVIIEGQNRVESIALVHKMLYQNDDVSCIVFKDYVQELTGEIANGFSKPGIKIEITHDDIAIGLDDATPLGLILTELLTNSYKYAFPGGEGTIRIALKCDTEHKLHFSYCDDGVGLPSTFNPLKAKSTGLRLVYLLAEEMNSTLKLDSRHPLTFSIIFQPKS